MNAARLTSIALFLILVSLHQPRSGHAQIVPDWPNGGNAPRPPEPVEMAARAVGTTGVVETTSALIRRMQSAVNHRWFVRVARKPVGYSPSWVPQRRPAAS